MQGAGQSALFAVAAVPIFPPSAALNLPLPFPRRGTGLGLRKLGERGVEEGLVPLLEVADKSLRLPVLDLGQTVKDFEGVGAGLDLGPCCTGRRAIKGEDVVDEQAGLFGLKPHGDLPHVFGGLALQGGPRRLFLGGKRSLLLWSRFRCAVRVSTARARSAFRSWFSYNNERTQLCFFQAAKSSSADRTFSS